MTREHDRMCKATAGGLEARAHVQTAALRELLRLLIALAATQYADALRAGALALADGGRLHDEADAAVSAKVAGLLSALGRVPAVRQ